MKGVRAELAVEPAQRSRRGPKLRETKLADYQQIASLEAAHGLSVKTYEEWEDLHLGNPLKPALKSACPIGWVIEAEDGRIVGSVENVPLQYEFGGRSIQAVTGRSLVVVPAYRSASLLLLDQLLNQPGAELFLTNAITPASAPAFDIFGCQRVPAGQWDQSAFWIVDYRHFIESALRLKNIALARPLSYPFAAAVCAKDRLTENRLRESGVEVQSCTGFDERFNDFWERVRSNQPHRLLAVRSRETLEWHFRSALRQNRVWIATVVDGPRIAAYAILDRRDNVHLGLRRIRLVDFQSHDGTTTLLEPLLSWSLTKCRHEGIHMLENVGAWMGAGELIDSLAPRRRQLSVWTYVYRSTSQDLSKRLRDPHTWTPTLFDASGSL